MYDCSDLLNYIQTCNQFFIGLYYPTIHRHGIVFSIINGKLQQKTLFHRGKEEQGLSPQLERAYQN